MDNLRMLMPPGTCFLGPRVASFIVRKTALASLVVLACGDPTGIGVLDLREGGRYRMTYQGVIRYDCAPVDTTRLVFSIPLEPPDSVLCGAETGVILVRHDTVTAEIALTAAAEEGTLFPNSREFEGDATAQYGSCAVRPAAQCSEGELSARVSLARMVLRCHQAPPDESPINHGPYDIFGACAGAVDSAAVILLYLHSSEQQKSLYARGVETAAGVEGDFALWSAGYDASDGGGDVPFPSAFDFRSQSSTHSWVLEPIP